jgi:hypothetical protein
MQYISAEQPIAIQILEQLSEKMFGGFVKGVIDIEKKIIAIDADMHVDLEQVLLEDGSSQSVLWGINLYPGEPGDDFLEFDSMINIRPNQNNRSRSVEDESIQNVIREIVMASIIKE